MITSKILTRGLADRSSASHHFSATVMSDPKKKPDGYADDDDDEVPGLDPMSDSDDDELPDFVSQLAPTQTIDRRHYTPSAISYDLNFRLKHRTQSSCKQPCIASVPKFHTAAHASPPACRIHGEYLVSFEYFVYGKMDGESVERAWSELNPCAASTKQMGPGKRAERLDGARMAKL
ncbi:hypothetical protein C8R43DRAFT_1127135 [Mycena crocata]|nr:hypothetical protein C8R43DRAFT_1127135 [Mycena crocata]